MENRIQSRWIGAISLLLGALLLLGGGYVVAQSMWLSATPPWEAHRGLITARFVLGVAVFASGLAAGVLGLLRVR